MGKSGKRQKERSLVYRVWISDRYFTPLLVRNKTKWKMVNLLFKRRNPLWQSIRIKKKKEEKNIARSADLTRSVVQNVVLFLRYFIVSISNHDSTLSSDPLIFSTMNQSLSLSLFSLYLKNRESDRIFKPFRYVRVYSASCGPTASLLTTR